MLPPDEHPQIKHNPEAQAGEQVPHADAGSGDIGQASHSRQCLQGRSIGGNLAHACLQFIGCPFPQQLHAASTSGETAEIRMSNENGIT